MAHYYVDAVSGDDAASGGISDPWRTVERVNAGPLSPGDAVFFARGDGQVWREMLRPANGALGAELTYAAYGIGAAPQIVGSEVANCPILWTEVGADLWELSYAYAPYRAPGFLFQGDTIWGNRVKAQADLLQPMDWFVVDYDSAPRVRMRCVGNPAEVYPQLEVAQDRTGIFFAQDAGRVVLDGLHVHHCGRWGIDLQPGVHNITIRNCTVEHCGGDAYKSGSTPHGWERQGGGINHQGNAAETFIVGCTVWNAFDACIAVQGFNDELVQERIHVYNNLLGQGHYGLTFWANNADKVLRELWVFGNRFEQIGKGFGTTSVPGGRNNSAGIKTFHIDAAATMQNVRILANHFEGWQHSAVEIHKNAYEQHGVYLNHNTYVGDPAALAWTVRDGGSSNSDNWPRFTGAEMGQWRMLTGFDTQSTFFSG